MSDVKLLPCPFCGGEIKLDEDDFYMFCCDTCGAGITFAHELEKIAQKRKALKVGTPASLWNGLWSSWKIYQKCTAKNTISKKVYYGCRMQ